MTPTATEPALEPCRRHPYPNQRVAETAWARLRHQDNRRGQALRIVWCEEHHAFHLVRMEAKRSP